MLADFWGTAMGFRAGADGAARRRIGGWAAAPDQCLTITGQWVC